MLDFTDTPQRRRKAAQARNRKALVLMSLFILIPVAASAFGPDVLHALLNG